MKTMPNEKEIIITDEESAVRPTAAPTVATDITSDSELADALLSGVIDDPSHPFALLFSYNGRRTVVCRGYTGDGHGGVGDAIGTDTRFRLASVTKQLVARAVTALVFQGKMDFDDGIRTFFPSLPDVYEAVTVRMLLNHTSGIPNYEAMPDDGSGLQVVDTDVPVYLATRHKTYFTPGSDYRYSNSGFVLLGLIVEKVSGMSLSEAMKTLVFDPAGMEKTLVNIQGKTVIPKRAYGHRTENGSVTERDQYRWSATVGDGGVYSCLEDLDLWIDDMLKNNERLSGSMLKDVMLPGGAMTGYGMGIRLKKAAGKRIICHTGETIGFRSAVMFSPDIPLRLVFLTNREVNEPFDVINIALKTVFGESLETPIQI
ncbi:MAG: beta-lactamase family protein [Clostridia bacterium]|nr:beta-lactamase family protein [Clostridia bacterium]